MSRFFVGQRVRVRWARETRLVGMEGRINEIMGPARDGDTGEIRLGYGLDISPIEFHPRDGWLTFAAEQLEPILPEGAQPSEFETLAELIDSLQVTA